jgi:hypothetical protein
LSVSAQRCARAARPQNNNDASINSQNGPVEGAVESICKRCRSTISQDPVQHHFKVHFFRALTVILAWFLIVAAFYERPEVLTAMQRLVQRGIESLGDAIPSPWGPRIEFVFREIGGLIWLQITLFVVMLRIVLSTFAALSRFIVRRDRAA